MRITDRDHCAYWAGAGLMTCLLMTAAALSAESGRSPAVIYATTCGYCHGANVGPIILGRHMPAAAVEGVVRTGPNAMPAFRPTEISDAELHALAKWIETSASSTVEHGQ